MKDCHRRTREDLPVQEELPPDAGAPKDMMEHSSHVKDKTREEKKAETTITIQL